MMDQRVLLMVNPMAGRQKIRNELIYVVDALTKAGYETTIYTTGKRCHQKAYGRKRQPV